MLISPVEGADILFATGPRTILNDNRPATFLPGWRPVAAYSGLPPVTIVTFVDEVGREGLWFLDWKLLRVGGSVWEAPPSMKADLLDGLCVLLDGLWRALVLSDRPSPPTEHERAFLELPSSLRHHLLDLYLSAADFSVDHRRFAEPGTGLPDLPVLDCGSRRIPLRTQGLHALFDPGLLQREQQRLVQTGSMRLPSPVDGRLLTCSKAFAIDADLIAYRLHDDRWQLTSYVLAGDILFRTMAVYIPEANLVLSADPEAFRQARPQLAVAFHRHLAEYGRQLFRYLAASGTRPLHVWRGRNALHLGHLLWNDLSGIERLVQSGPPASLPPFLLCDAGSGPEMYGELDRIFPELDGRVLRREEPFAALIAELYEMNVCLFRASGMKVTADLRARITALIPVRQAAAPVILLGLRTENRTLADLPGFCRALVTHVAATIGRAVLVVDGHNQRAGGGGMIWSHGELDAPVSPVEAERSLLETIRAAAHGTTVEIVSTLGQPVEESLGWCASASFFVSFWGAGLAKYRWVCNRPGVVLTNRWNLGHLNDIAIYSDAATMDDPTEMAFLPADAVEDLPASRLLIRHGDAFDPSLCNFQLSWEAFRALFDSMAERCLAAAAAWNGGSDHAATPVDRSRQETVPVE